MDVEKKGAKKFKLDANDERVLALGLIEANEFLRRSERLELSFEISEISSSENIKTYSDFNQVELLFDEAPILEFSTTL